MARLKKNRNINSRNLEDHIVEEGHGVEVGADNAPVENINWQTMSGEVHADPLMESGVGQRLIVRRFQFKLAPGEINKATKDELLEWHKKNTVIPMLWKDELELAGEPRIVAGKKGAFTIVAVCMPRIVGGVKSYIETKPELIQDIIQKNG